MRNLKAVIVTHVAYLSDTEGLPPLVSKQSELNSTLKDDGTQEAANLYSLEKENCPLDLGAETLETRFFSFTTEASDFYGTQRPIFKLTRAGDWSLILS